MRLYKVTARTPLFRKCTGGLTTADQLRKIADVAERYQIANVAITSEQRILLMGVKQEDLTSVWAELDMPLSATYGNMVQNVKKHVSVNMSVNVRRIRLWS
ncbi:hypothetical protein GCM10020331_071470 [Ectobacillus funiculus]